MDTYRTLFQEYLTNQKSNSSNTIESYLRDVSYFLDYLEQDGIASPLDADEQTLSD